MHLDRTQLDGHFTRADAKGNCRYDQWLKRVTAEQERSKEDFVKHFESQYDGRLPIWVLTEIMDFGSLTYLYDGAKRPDRDSIAAGLGIIDGSGLGNGVALVNWMRVLNYLRNTCAHHSRLWNRNMTVQIAPKHLRHVPDLAHIARDDRSLPDPAGARNRVYGALTVLAFLMREIHDETAWCRQVRSVLATGLTDSGRSPAEMGFPAGWEQFPLWSGAGSP